MLSHFLELVCTAMLRWLAYLSTRVKDKLLHDLLDDLVLCCCLVSTVRGALSVAIQVW